MINYDSSYLLSKLMLLSLVFSAEIECEIFGDHFCYPKTGGCELQIKVARDQENIFHFEIFFI